MRGVLLKASCAEQLLAQLAAIDIRVPLRTEGRTKHHTERWMLCRLLATLAEAKALTFPMKVLSRDKPDFSIEMPNGWIGIEATEAVGQQFAHYMAIAEREFPSAILEPSRFRWGAPKLSDRQLREILSQPRLTSTGWEGDQAEVEWAEAVKAAFQSKLSTLRQDDFKKYERNWLIIYDNLPLPEIDFSKAVDKLRVLLDRAWDSVIGFDAVFVESGKTVVRLTSVSADLLPLNNLWLPRPRERR